MPVASLSPQGLALVWTAASRVTLAKLSPNGAHSGLLLSTRDSVVTRPWERLGTSWCFSLLETPFAPPLMCWFMGPVGTTQDSARSFYLLIARVAAPPCDAVTQVVGVPRPTAPLGGQGSVTESCQPVREEDSGSPWKRTALCTRRNPERFLLQKLLE